MSDTPSEAFRREVDKIVTEMRELNQKLFQKNSSLAAALEVARMRELELQAEVRTESNKHGAAIDIGRRLIAENSRLRTCLSACAATGCAICTRENS